MYDHCFTEVTCEESVLGKVHDILAQRRGKVLTQVVDIHTFAFNLTLRIPANETFDLSVELRRKSSGKATLNFKVDGWYLHPQDPFPEALMTSEVIINNEYIRTCVHSAYILVCT